MVLTAEQVKSAARGYLDFAEKEDGFHFYRFRDWQMQHYKDTNAGHYMKTTATSGISLEFMTDSGSLAFSYTVTPGSSRKFYYFDIYVDGVMTLHCGENPMWIMKGEVKLKNIPEGEHRISVWLPNLTGAVLKDITLDDGASFAPVPAMCRMLCYGDSISQGYDAVFPSLSYTNQLARHFDAYSVNQCIGGERFVPELLTKELGYDPDIVTVAYGTNDWSGLTRDVFFANTDAFLEKLAVLYPTAKIFVLTPLWRGDKDKVTKFGSYFEAVKYIADKAASCGFNVIDGYNLTPHTSEFYSDQRLHPNDLGYMEYAARLIPEIEKKL